MSVEDRIWEILRSDLDEKDLTVAEIAKAAESTVDVVQALIDDNADIIAWVGEREGNDLYISTLHMDPEGYY